MVLQQEFEKVQNRAARFVTCNCCFETVSKTGILKKKKKKKKKKLKWEYLKRGGETVD